MITSKRPNNNDESPSDINASITTTCIHIYREILRLKICCPVALKIEILNMYVNNIFATIFHSN